jgi:hypothetical protein
MTNVDETLDEIAEEGYTTETFDDIFYIGVDKVEEHDDGAATYTFAMDDKTTEALAKIGLEFTVFCAAYELDLQYVLDNLKYLAEKRDNSENDK